MSKEIKDLISNYLNLSESEGKILLKINRQLNREERKIYYQKINPKKRDIKFYLEENFEKLNTVEQEIWKRFTIESMLKNGGEPDLSDSMVLDILGRFNIYQEMRSEAKEKEIPLKIGSTSGGCVTFIVVLTTIALIISFISNKL